eukprot:4180513-Prymnesium_polylepis.2
MAPAGSARIPSLREYLVLEYNGTADGWSHCLRMINVRVSLWAPSQLPPRGMGPRPIVEHRDRP